MVVAGDKQEELTKAPLGLDLPPVDVDDIGDGLEGYKRQMPMGKENPGTGRDRPSSELMVLTKSRCI